MTDTSNFDPAVFMETSVEGAMETRYTPVDEGDYTAYIDDTKIRAVGDDSLILDVSWKIVDEGLAEKMGLEQVLVRQGIFLDAEQAEGGMMQLQTGPNKNIKLGRLREALGQNTGKPWTFAQLKGAGPVIIHVTQRSDKTDPSIIYNDVQRTTALQEVA